MPDRCFFCQTSSEVLKANEKVGAPYVPEDDEAVQESAGDLLAYQTGGFADSAIFDFYGRAAVALRIVITMMRGGFAIAGFGLGLPWNDQVNSLPDPRPRFQRIALLTRARFCASVARAVKRPRKRAGMFRPGESVAGYLVGTSREPWTENLRHGADVCATLVIYEQFWCPHRSLVRLWADRSHPAPHPVRRVRLQRRRIWVETVEPRMAIWRPR